jgi:hypothetical protein
MLCGSLGHLTLLRMVRVRAGAEAEHFPSARIYGNTLYAEVK